VLSVLNFEDLREVVLIGHSYGGMVATGVADQARDRVAQLTYLDAFVPTSGQALIDLVPPAERQRLLDSVKTGDGWRVTPNPTPPDTSPEDLEWISKYGMPQSVKCFEQPLRLQGELSCHARISTAPAMPIKSRSLSSRAARMATPGGKPTNLTPATAPRAPCGPDCASSSRGLSQAS
jgi:pimeloyl-ACP methyl ester carboxylesterase